MAGPQVLNTLRAKRDQISHMIVIYEKRLASPPMEADEVAPPADFLSLSPRGVSCDGDAGKSLQWSDLSSERPQRKRWAGQGDEGRRPEAGEGACPLAPSPVIPALRIVRHPGESLSRLSLPDLLFSPGTWWTPVRRHG
jgi:hypothetical protein